MVLNGKKPLEKLLNLIFMTKGYIPMGDDNAMPNMPNKIDSRKALGIRVVSVSLPTSYNLTNGIVVDVSDLFSSSINDVWIMRGSWGGILFEITQETTNIFSNRKCILRAKYPTIGNTPQGTVSQPTFSGSALGTHTHTFTGDALTSHTHTFTGNVLNASGTCIVLCTNNHPGLSAPTGTNSSTSGGTPTGSNASVSAGTPAGTISQPTFTGQASAASPATEIANGVNLQSLTGFSAITLGIIGD